MTNPPIEPLRVTREKARTAKPIQLPPEARRFLRKRHRARLRSIVHALHRWLARRALSLRELTPELLRRFVQRPRGIRVAARTSYCCWHEVRRYLEWLHERGLIGFDPDRLRHHPKRLPLDAREFIASLTPTHRPETCRHYAVSLRRFHGWLARRGLEAHELRREDIVCWLQELHDASLHASTRIHLLQNVRSYLHWLGERRPLRAAPDDLIRPRDMPKLPHYLPRPLTADSDRELQSRLAAADDPAAIGLLVMRRTGLRIGELRTLEYDCLRPHEHTPLLKVPLGKMNNERLVPVDIKTVDLIRRLQAMRPRPRAWLLPERDGKPMSRGRLYAALDQATRDLPDPTRITTHRLRHTYATEMLSAGMSLVGVMRLLGHRDFRMTLRYTAITPETVGAEYHKAIGQLATKYRLPAPPAINPPSTPDTPNELLDHLARWLRKNAHSRRPLRALLKRIERLRVDVHDVTSAPNK
jgi:site-specific recombinase XerD